MTTPLKDIGSLSRALPKKSFLKSSYLWNNPASQITPVEFLAAIKVAEINKTADALRDADTALSAIRKAIASGQIDGALIERLTTPERVDLSNVYNIDYGITKRAVVRILGI